MKTLIITTNKLGIALKKPFILEVEEAQTPVEEKTLQYILDTFISRGSNLAVFTCKNSSTWQVAKHYLFNRSSSEKTLYQTIYCLEKFRNWTGMQPDKLISRVMDENGIPKPNEVMETKREIDDFLGYLKLTRNLEPVTLRGYVQTLKAFFMLNGVDLQLPYIIRTCYKYPCRAISRVEIQKMMSVANLRERVVIAVLGSGGFRVGTLSKLKYRHVKHDLERKVVPVCVQVEAEITKGKYRNYFTFINQEAVDYLNAYLQMRRVGTPRVEPEEIGDESPLVSSANRAARCLSVKPVAPAAIQRLLHELYFRTGLMKRGSVSKRYALRAHSLRKFFQTELAARGVEHDYIEFMMGHAVSRYNDINSKGIEYLRGVYLTAGLTIMPKQKLSKLEALKEIIVSWGLDPNKILSQQVHVENDDEALT